MMGPTLFFFFQAEDGIRDLYVTGVQTCALPIWGHPGANEFRRRNVMKFVRIHAQKPVAIAHVLPGLRSEERRVGKSVDLGGRRVIRKKNPSEITSRSAA